VVEWLARRLRAYAEKDGRGYPDWAVRYLPAVRRMRRRGAFRGGRVVEAGANECGLARFANVRVIAVDIDMAHLRAARMDSRVLPVRADLAALPFRDGAVDVCVSMDTFEHLPPGTRGAAAAEIVRILCDSGHAVVSFPAGDQTLRAEQAIQEAYRAYTGRSLRWLDEHAAAGLPVPRDLAADFETAAGACYGVTRGKNASLCVWRWMWRVMMCGWPGRGNALFQALLRAVTSVLCRVHVGTCYRAVIWIEPRAASVSSSDSARKGVRNV